ncbi:hypothetical protein ACN2C7_17845 [Caulobacter sp. ErkDOM-E]|uniref:hypothetical protein n=1 Tax=Caulobacter sp. ErkDOM-E TaxID=3402778 RepID=UPI003AF51429
MSYPNAFPCLSRALAALRQRRQRPATSEIIRFVTKNDGVCYCQVVRCKIGRKRHVAFLNVAGSLHHPTGDIEGLASSALRDMGAPAASLVFWEVDRYETDDRIFIHRVEFQSPASGRFSDPKWIPEALPEALAKQVALAQHEIFLNWTPRAPRGRR